MKVSLVMFREDGNRREFPLDPGRTIIGRREECDLRIPLAEISRRHAQITVSEKDRKVVIKDLGSSNGTYLNNRRLTAEHTLSPGDHVILGPVVFTVRIDGEPKEVRPVQTRLEAKQTSSREAAAAAPKRQDEDSDVFDDDDPISALEALAASDETAALDLNEDDFDLGSSRV